jgi:hypothetical protein
MTHDSLKFSPAENSLAWFLFTLLKRLQDLGTCPAVDWLRYRDVLTHAANCAAHETRDAHTPGCSQP